MRLTGQVRDNPLAIESFDEDEAAVERARDPDPTHLTREASLYPAAEPTGIQEQITLRRGGYGTRAGEAQGGGQSGEGLMRMLHDFASGRTVPKPPC
ncbi:hypothetical protein [Parafrankia sp. BMG5.11]|uniref:hypothetical protein n=1 Tax=Parafrankia sp. BMG5.11 TaxID=222540 RepID=UPI001FB37CC2|nr:hypothetical protein [Parafrankia sp. BMG5.11]